MTGDKTTPVVVAGGGGHAKVVLDILRESGHQVIGYCDPAHVKGQLLDNVPCLGSDEALAAAFASGARSAIVALGDNALRERTARQIVEIGFDLVNAIHPSAQISRSVVLGRGIAIMPGAVINASTVIGDNVIVNTAASIDHDCRIGNSTHIAPGVHLSGYVNIAERVLIGVGSSIGRGQKLFIGEDAIVGAGSVVIRDVAPGLVVVGNPARLIAEIRHQQ